MRYGSVCSGIEAASAAWRHLGWDCAFVSEIEKFPAAVLKERLPLVPNLGDFTKIQKGDYDGDIDLIVGGTPCQSYSTAGKQGGIADPRGQLTLGFADLARRTGARWLVWENVPSVLSSGAGRDFAAFLSLLAGWKVPVPEGGWGNAGICTNAPGRFGLAWRVLDAQYVRVEQFPGAIPQRRRRIFVVGHLDSWKRAAEVLFDGELCGGSEKPRREVRKAAAGTDGADDRENPLCCAIDPRWCNSTVDGASPTILSTDYKEPKALVLPYECYPLDMLNLDGRTKCIKSKCYDENGESAYTITKSHPAGVCTPGVLRRMTPVECERLMGFEDDWTRIPWRGRPASECPDGPRYKAIGNSMCVNCMMWIGERIDTVERTTKRAKSTHKEASDG